MITAIWRKSRMPSTSKRFRVKVRLPACPPRGPLSWQAIFPMIPAAALIVLWSLATPLAIAQDKAASSAEVDAALKVLDRWRGRWKTEVTTTKPNVTTITSVTTNTWILGNRFLQGDSGIKSDGQHDMSMMTFDAIRRAYPLWIFTSPGIVYYLADGQWDEARRTMKWDSPINLSGSYVYHCQFLDDDHYRCQSTVKNVLGSVLIELTVNATRIRQ